MNPVLKIAASVSLLVAIGAALWDSAAYWPAMVSGGLVAGWIIGGALRELDDADS